MMAILIMELKGFGAISTELAKNMDSIGLTPERIRATGIEIVSKTIKDASTKAKPLTSLHIGGDTWYFTFDTVENAIIFGCHLLHLFLGLTTERGIFYVKPSVALGYGNPKFQGDRFLDDTSIKIYRIADKGLPFHFYILEEAIPMAKQIGWLMLKSMNEHRNEPGELILVDWQRSLPESEVLQIPAISIPILLLDSEVIYSSSAREAIELIKHQQKISQTIMAFGGPVPVDIPFYLDYLRDVLILMKENTEQQWTVLSYIPTDEPFYSYTWLELCRRLSIIYPTKYAFAAFSIPAGQLRPFSYHIYGKNTVHIGLRAFSPHRGTQVMSSAIMLKNERIAQRFHDEFMENWRRVGPLNDEKYGVIVSQIEGLNNRIKKDALRIVDSLLGGSADDV